MKPESNLPVSDQLDTPPVTQPYRSARNYLLIVGIIFIIFILTSVLVVIRGATSNKPDSNSKPSTQVSTQSPYKKSLNLLLSPTIQATVTPIPPKVLMKLNGYQIEEFGLEQSPFCGEFFKECPIVCKEIRDLRLIDNQFRVVVPSLLQLTYQNPNLKNSNCALYPSVDLFSAPGSGSFIYLSTSTGAGTDAPYSGIDDIFRFNYLTIKLYKLLSSDYLRKTDLYRGSANDSYELLPDGKRLIKWNKDEVSLVNLESDTVTKLYTPPNNEWLISTIEFGMGQIPGYDVQINGSEIIVGLYSKVLTEGDKKIVIDKFDNVNIEGEPWGRSIRPKFIDRIHLIVP